MSLEDGQLYKSAPTGYYTGTSAMATLPSLNSEVTADTLLSPSQAYDSNGQVITGTMSKLINNGTMGGVTPRLGGLIQIPQNYNFGTSWTSNLQLYLLQTSCALYKLNSSSAATWLKSAGSYELMNWTAGDTNKSKIYYITATNGSGTLTFFFGNTTYGGLNESTGRQHYLEVGFNSNNHPYYRVYDTCLVLTSSSTGDAISYGIISLKVAGTDFYYYGFNWLAHY